MPTYTYETIPSNPGDEPRRFEITQRMSDQSLTEDPATGEAVRKIITGGIGIKLGLLRRSTVVDKKSPAATACGCASGKPHRHT
jgi:predicted nucleic acid-binding Zn ribbon protein